MTIDYTAISIEDADFKPWDDVEYDPAVMKLIVPRMLIEPYGSHIGLEERGQELWRDLDLRNHWQECREKRWHEPIPDILEFLGGAVMVDYQMLGEDTPNIRLSIYELPRRITQNF